MAESVIESVVSSEGMRAYWRLPRRIDASTRVIVAVHGISRNAGEHARAFARVFPKDQWLVIAPRFDGARFRGYQRLEKSALEGSPRPDEVLNRLLDGIFGHLGLTPRPVVLAGYSGGAQFAHRYALRHPGRVSHLSLMAAGVYTFPDPETCWPRGLGRRRGMPGPLFLEALLAIPTLVVVGSGDLRRDASLRRGKRVDTQQGRTRVERARNWVAAIRSAQQRRGIAPLCSYLELSRCGHDFTQCARAGGVEAILGLATSESLPEAPPAGSEAVKIVG